ncbi:hypothetical protein ABW19_dt0206481 [Dactylella cylindrospora]|nr:hypothetical protein ABW19_dt0206481 [Dactylella cylindrospora]
MASRREWKMKQGGIDWQIIVRGGRKNESEMRRKKKSNSRKLHFRSELDKSRSNLANLRLVLPQILPILRFGVDPQAGSLHFLHPHQNLIRPPNHTFPMDPSDLAV